MMDTEDKLHAINEILAEWFNAPDGDDGDRAALTRIRAILAEPLPSVEWHTRPADGEDYAEPEPDVDLIVSDESVPGEETGEPFGIAIRFGADGPRYYETGFSTRAAAKARALAIYVALRGVT